MENVALNNALLVRPDAILRCDTAGSGPDVLLLHAGAERRQVWQPVMAPLAIRGFCTTAYDQRGHGDSGGDRGQPVTEFGQDTVAMLERLTLPVVVGASLGGFAALLALAAAEIEADTAGLVLVDVVPDPDPERTRRFLAALNMDRLPLVEDILGRRELFRTIAAGLRLPVLAVAAGASLPLANEDTLRFRALMPHAAIVNVPDSSHLIARDKPVELARILGDFLESDLVRDRRIRRFLARAGSGAIAHPGGTLEQHLHRTADTLRSWGGSRVLVDAARVHAAYGTEGFALGLVVGTERATVTKIVGADAEQLIWDYGRCERRRSYATWHSDAPQLFDRSSGNAVGLSDEQRALLIELTIANELDVLAHDPDSAARYGAALRGLFARWLPFASAGAQSAIASFTKP